MNTGQLQALPSETPRPAPVRVAFFSDAFPERNGTGAYYHDLLPQLRAHVEALQVLQPTNGGEPPLISIAMPGDPEQRLVTPSPRQVRAVCRELRPNVVVVVTPGLFGLLGAWQARRHGAVLISAFHTDFEQLARMYWNPISRFFVNIVLRTANRIVCGLSSRVLINNVRLRDDVLRLGARDVEVIGTPLPREFIQTPPRRMPPRLERVCFAGRLAPEKNVEHIIDAARRLPQLEFVIGGDGPLRAQLEKQAEGIGNLRFTGWLDRSALVDLLDSASLLLLPSAFETFGSIALEAMARGRPALVSTSAGIHAWPTLRPGLFAIDSPTAITSELEKLAGFSAVDWQQKSTAARAVALDLNGRTIEHWVELLQRQLPRDANG